jgi:hypothetical protein
VCSGGRRQRIRYTAVGPVTLRLGGRDRVLPAPLLPDSPCRSSGHGSLALHPLDRLYASRDRLPASATVSLPDHDIGDDAPDHAPVAIDVVAIGLSRSEGRSVTEGARFAWLALLALSR